MEMVSIGKALAIGLSTIGPGLALGRAVSSYFESVARNPEAEPALSSKFFPGLAFIEALAIYGLVIAFTIN